MDLRDSITRIVKQKSQKIRFHAIAEMKYLILATLCLHGVCTVTGHPATPIRDLLERFRNGNGSLELGSKSMPDSERIIGGGKCNVPYAVSLQAAEVCPGQPQNWEYICTGTLLSCSKVVTSAHCLLYVDIVLANNPEPNPGPCEVKVRVVHGTSKLQLGAEEPEGAEVQYISASHTCVPLGFSYFYTINDVGVIHLPANFKTCDGSTLPCLPNCSNEQFCPETVGTVHGWGSNAVEGGGFSEELKCVQTKNVCLQDCRKIFIAEADKLGSWAMCAKGLNGGACPGDAGGALIVKGDDSICSNRIVGVTSFGRAGRCGVYPDVFANLCDSEINTWLRCNLERGLGDAPPTYRPQSIDGTRSTNVNHVNSWSSGEDLNSDGSESSKCQKKCKFECLCQALEHSLI